MGFNGIQWDSMGFGGIRWDSRGIDPGFEEIQRCSIEERRRDWQESRIAKMVRSWHSIKAIGLVMAGCLFACGVMVVGGSLQQADVGTPPTRFNVRLLRGHRTATGVLNPSSARRQSQAVTQNAKPLSTHQSMEDATLHRQQRQRQRQHRRMVLKTIATTLLAQASAVARTDPRQ
eukprot:1372492-Amorphochlora_amoeboformis.AAC.1